MPARLRLALLVAGTFAVAAAAGVLLLAHSERQVSFSTPFAGAQRPHIPPTDFRARDEAGRILNVADLRGTPVVVTFLYTTCKDTCPLIVDQIRIALDDLGHDVPVVAVSVDPANDTASRARSFALKHGMHGRMRWALGTTKNLQRIWNAYGVQPQSPDFEHSASTVLLDAKGAQRVGFAASVLTPDGLAHDIAELEHQQRASQADQSQDPAPQRDPEDSN